MAVESKERGTSLPARILTYLAFTGSSLLDAHHYPLPVPEDLFAKQNGRNCFAKLDLSEAYLQIEVAEESRELLTINTHRGWFQFTRLPFGIKAAPAIFQQTMDRILTDTEGAVAYQDDIHVTGSIPDELMQRLFDIFPFGFFRPVPVVLPFAFFLILECFWRLRASRID
ncbi:unnamed protein product [Schistocephalus solidus]|uniref:Reverse transcriptase domain-containing protein n=1 Tax=Schistocephalus solidus TaxID=70667 RepID=A0A183TB34_SCHSO|nr:unnamed protein product [Schistocephalus solidus]